MYYNVFSSNSIYVSLDVQMLSFYFENVLKRFRTQLLNYEIQLHN